jgi:general secretion pathway protein H
MVWKAGRGTTATWGIGSAMNSDVQRGVTLLELMVVLAILALGIAAFPIAMGNLSASRAAESLGAQFASKLGQARAKSVVDGARVSVPADAGALSTGSGGLLSRRAGSTVLRYKDIDGVDSESIEFYPDGSSSGGVLTIEYRDRRVELRISGLTGRITQRQSRT